MILTGTVHRLKDDGEFAFIRTDSKDFFAYRKEFLQRDLVKVGQTVKFQAALTHKGWQAFHIEAA